VNLVPEILGWLAFMIAVATVVIIRVKLPDWRSQLAARKRRRHNEALEYTRATSFQATLDQQKAAIESAIAVIEADFPDFPADVRDQLLAAHEAGNTITRRRT
jgi:hypothetical protein